MMRFASTLAMAMLATACGEKAQTAGAVAIKTDAKPWTGANAAYMAPGWKAGDAKAWEEQLKSRAQAQNEYVRTPAAK